MTVELLNYTSDAMNLLLMTKGTRLAHTDDPSTWSEKKKEEHLAYMRDTIKSSWEFVDYTFRISGVTRAFTHQLVRTRTGSYAQESQRTVDVRKHEVVMPDFNGDVVSEQVWMSTVANMIGIYGQLIDNGIPVQDARGLLPTNTTTSIICKFTLRGLSEMARVRLCVRTQGEYQDVFREMRRQVVIVHPWAGDFINVQCVADGTCAFPRYAKDNCPIYDPRMDLTQLKSDTAKKFWSQRHVANPIAKDGKTM